MADPTTFALMGAIIFIGFLGSIFFKKTKISEVLILMLVGFLLGPIFKVVDSPALVEFVPLFAGVALIILLFDGGLNLNFRKVLYELAPSSIFTVVSFVLSMAGIAIAVHFLAGWDWLLALIFGSVVSGTTTPIVMALVSNLRIREEIKTLLVLESALTDVLTIVVAIALAQVMVSDGFDLSRSANAIAGGFAIAMVIGLIAGAVWVNFLKNFTGKFDYMLTIAAAFILYGAVEFTHGNGGIAVLIFGIVLSNAKHLVQMVTQKIDNHVELPPQFKQFQEEISFFVRTFFFVYMGLLLNVQALTLQMLGIGVAVTLAALATRWLAVKMLHYGNLPEANIIITTMPRGLAAAVMSTIPTTYGISAPGFTELVMLVIIGSNVIATLGVFMIGDKGAVQKKPSIVKVNSKAK